MTAHAALDRIEPRDFYRQLDWIRDEWDACSEPDMSRHLDTLRRTLEHLPSRYYEASRPIFEQLGYCRLMRDPPYHARILDLVDLIRQWDRERPPLLECPECGLTMRGHRSLATHRLVVHQVEDGLSG